MPVAYWKYKGEQMYVHFDAHEKGGIRMKDNNGIVPSAAKDMASKLTGKLLKG